MLPGSLYLRKSIVALFFFSVIWLPAQDIGLNNREKAKVDSLFHVIKSPAHDTVLFKAYRKLGAIFQDSYPDSAIYFHSWGLIIAKRMNDKYREARINCDLAWDHFVLGNYPQSLGLYNSSLKICDSLSLHSPDPSIQKKAKYLKTGTLGNMGTVYTYQGNYLKAIENNFIVLKAQEQSNDKKGIAASLGNIATIYLYLEEYDKALDYNLKSLRYFRELGEKQDETIALCNIGNIYKDKEDYDNALAYFLKSFENCKEIGDENTRAAVLGNIGIVHMNQKNYTRALDYINDALKLNTEVGNKPGQCVNLLMIGQVNDKLNKQAEAQKYMDRSYKIAVDIGNLEMITNCHEAYFNFYEKHKQPGLALHHYQMYISYKDSISNAEKTKAMIQKEMQFNYEKKAAADSVRVSEEQRVTKARLMESEATLRMDRIIRSVLFGGLVLIIVISVFMVNRFRIVKRQKKLIEIQKKIVEEQKLLVELKQSEILDSIYYAKRIQTALLTNEKYIDRVIKKLTS